MQSFHSILKHGLLYINCFYLTRTANRRKSCRQSAITCAVCVRIQYTVCLMKRIQIQNRIFKNGSPRLPLQKLFRKLTKIKALHLNLSRPWCCIKEEAPLEFLHIWLEVHKDPWLCPSFNEKQCTVHFITVNMIPQKGYFSWMVLFIFLETLTTVIYDPSAPSCPRWCRSSPTSLATHFVLLYSLHASFKKTKKQKQVFINNL